MIIKEADPHPHLLPLAQARQRSSRILSELKSYAAMSTTSSPIPYERVHSSRLILPQSQ